MAVSDAVHLAFADAAKRGDLQAMQGIWRDNSIGERAAQDRLDLLQCAESEGASKGHLGVVQWVEAQVAAGNCGQLQRHVALTVAAGCGHVEVFRYLCTLHGAADEDNKHFYRISCLNVSVMAGHVGVPQVLADVVGMDATQDDLLIAAVFANNSEDYAVLRWFCSRPHLDPACILQRARLFTRGVVDTACDALRCRRRWSGLRSAWLAAAELEARRTLF